MATKLLLLVLFSSSVSAWVAPQSATRQRSTQLRESFGYEYAEDSYVNQPDFLKGEAEYKQWVNKIDSNSFLNRKVRITKGTRWGVFIDMELRAANSRDPDASFVCLRSTMSSVVSAS
jgi:hypothetical protein